MMNKDFMRQLMEAAAYSRKADTKTSYYYQGGSRVLPSRLDISFGNMFTKPRNKGRMVTEMVVGEIRGRFKTAEQSPLKQHTPYKVSSKIFRQGEFPQLIGWAGVAVSDKDGRTSKEEGVAVLADLGNDTVGIFFFAGIESLPDGILSVCSIVADEMKKGEAVLPPLDSKNEH